MYIHDLKTNGVLTTTIYKSDFDLKDLKDVYNDLNKAANKLTKIAADIENEELFLKLSKITNKVLQAKYELSDDVIDQFGTTCDFANEYKYDSD